MSIQFEDFCSDNIHMRVIRKSKKRYEYVSMNLTTRSNQIWFIWLNSNFWNHFWALFIIVIIITVIILRGYGFVMQVLNGTRIYYICNKEKQNLIPLDFSSERKCLFRHIFGILFFYSTLISLFCPSSLHSLSGDLIETYIEVFKQQYCQCIFCNNK